MTEATLVIFGSARIDAFMTLPDDKVDTFCRLDTHKCVMELSYSEKLPLNSVDFLVGGNGANVAVGTKRLGVESLLVAELGVGPLADHAKSELESKGIDMEFVTQSEDIAQGFGAVINYQGERTILSYYAPKEPEFPGDMCGATWAYLTSTGEKFENYYADIKNWVKACKPKLAFNPGGRQIAKGHEWMSEYLEITDLLIANREETERIVGNEGESFGKEKELIQMAMERGPSQVIMTDGTNGTYAFDGEKYWHAGIMPVDAIERTGAGDAFSAGALSAIIRGEDFGTALRWGTLNSTSVIGFIGPENGLLDEEGMDEWLERAKSSELEVGEL